MFLLGRTCVLGQPHLWPDQILDPEGLIWTNPKPESTSNPKNILNPEGLTQTKPKTGSNSDPKNILDPEGLKFDSKIWSTSGVCNSEYEIRKKNVKLKDVKKLQEYTFWVDPVY